MKRTTLTALALFGMCAFLNAQCPTGQVETFISVTTDNFGYEAYWELVPGMNSCGNGTIFSAGNVGQVGCSGGGQNNGTVGNGYANNMTITEGPWCLIDGNDYSIVLVDAFGDGGTQFEVEVEGFLVERYTGTGAGNVFTFTAELPPVIDARVSQVAIPAFIEQKERNVEVRMQNTGQTAITNAQVKYSVDGATVGTETFSGLNIDFGETALLSFVAPWMPEDTGQVVIRAELNSVNGIPDNDPSNDFLDQTVTVSPAIPNIVDHYFTEPTQDITIASSADGVAVPRDLAFHPHLSRSELWVINMGTENSGGSTVTISEAARTGQTSDWRQDGNAWHFMSLPTAIAFGDNGNFGTTPGVLDANHGGGSFTGPSLWPSDPAIYAIVGNPPSPGFNGSHLDMLHGSPFSMGMAHERDNVYWVFDSHNGELVRYDFVEDHGPGQDYHADAIVRRYREISVSRANTLVPSHMVIDDEQGWLYVAYHAAGSVLRLDINSGNVKNALPLINEALAEHSEMENVDWSNYITGLNEPCGIALVEDRLLVGDFSTGQITVFDLSQPTPVERFRINTGATQLMGIEIGPKGFLWYVDAASNEIHKMWVDVPDAPPVGIDTRSTDEIRIYPSPASDQITVEIARELDQASFQVMDLQGRTLHIEAMRGKSHRMDVSALSAGTYLYKVIEADVEIGSGNFVVAD